MVNLNFKSTKGFSLIEMMIVVAIMSLIATIGIPQYSKFKRKAHDTEAKVSLGALFVSEKIFHSDYNFYHTSLQAIGFVAPVDDAVMSIKAQCVGTNGTGTDTSCRLMVNVPDIFSASTSTQDDFYASAISNPAN